MFDISSDKVVLIPYKTGKYFCNACGRDYDVPAKGNRCPYCKSAQHNVHPTSGTLRVFKQFAWLEAGSVKVALSRPTHQRVTQAVGQYIAESGSL
jgi:primosomal protein N'